MDLPNLIKSAGKEFVGMRAYQELMLFYMARYYSSRENAIEALEADRVFFVETKSYDVAHNELIEEICRIFDMVSVVVKRAQAGPDPDSPLIQ
jgi:hypothetical protein